MGAATVTATNKAVPNEGTDWLVEAPSDAEMPGAIEAIWVQVGHLTQVTEWESGKRAKLAIGQRVSVRYRGPVAKTGPAPMRGRPDYDRAGQ